MNQDDRDLLDRVRVLHRGLTHRTMLLTRVQSEVDVFAEGLRDLGQQLHDLGADLLRRVEELDALPVSADAAQYASIEPWVCRLARDL